MVMEDLERMVTVDLSYLSRLHSKWSHCAEKQNGNASVLFN